MNKVLLEHSRAYFCKSSFTDTDSYSLFCIVCGCGVVLMESIQATQIILLVLYLSAIFFFFFESKNKNHPESLWGFVLPRFSQS